jgi:hypothetical protein
VDAGDGVMRAVGRVGGSARPWLRVGRQFLSHPGGRTAREWRRGAEGRPRAVFVATALGERGHEAHGEWRLLAALLAVAMLVTLLSPLLATLLGFFFLESFYWPMFHLRHD